MKYSFTNMSQLILACHKQKQYRDNSPVIAKKEMVINSPDMAKKEMSGNCHDSIKKEATSKYLGVDHPNPVSKISDMSALKTFDAFIQSVPTSQNVSTQSTSTSASFDAIIDQLHKEITLSPQLLASTFESFIHPEIIASSSHIQSDNMLIRLHNSMWSNYGSLDATLQECPTTVAVIVNDGMVSDIVHHELPRETSSMNEDFIKQNMTPNYVSGKNQFNLSPPWIEAQTSYLSYQTVAPPPYSESLKSSTLDIQSGYRLIHSVQNKGEGEIASQCKLSNSLSDYSKIHNTPITSDYQVLAFISCLFCWPIGLVALYYSNLCSIEVTSGNPDQANVYSRLALNTSLTALTLGTIGYFSFCIYKSFAFL
ncbi:hypothetical protein Btru_061482 [Bulinus truncatus]|nr:hypothetical protein Btru_061482 [Bulinus truncatus]